MRFFKTKDGRIFDLKEFTYDNEHFWYVPNKKWLARNNCGFTCWHWCFEEDFEKIPNVLGKLHVECIKGEECEFATQIEKLCDIFIYNDTLYHLYKSNNKLILCADNVDEYPTIVISNEMIKEGMYGAIWLNGEHNEPILKSIAKMNLEQKFELL